jgi:hypothetical protein
MSAYFSIIYICHACHSSMLYCLFILFIYFHISFSFFLRLILLQSVRKLEKDLAEKLGSKRCHSIPALKRGDHIDRYFPTAGKVLIGVDIRITL